MSTTSKRLDAGNRLRSADALAVIFGDQLIPPRDHPALRAIKKERDVVLMMEVDAEQQEGPSHKQRTALFLAAMRHYALDLIDLGYSVRYVRLDHPSNTQSFAGEVDRAVAALTPRRIAAMHPGDWRVFEEIQRWERSIVEVKEVVVIEDPYFFTTPDAFAAWAKGRKSLTMEYFYREQRRATGYLLDQNGDPLGGAWNHDKQNRLAFKDHPRPPGPPLFRIDCTTREVIDLVSERFTDAPGKLDASSFTWPVTTEQGEQVLDRFVEECLERFGPHEDAMWTEQPFLYHSMLSSSLNLHFLDPKRCCEKAIEAYERGRAPINSVEGFVRQILGWREYIRGVYWYEGAGYRDRNFLRSDGKLPGLYWDGQTDMRCLRECVSSVIDHAYAHHIPRLMVLANYAMIAGVSPRAIGDWFYGMFVDSVDWVTTPNTIGMGMHADGVRSADGSVESWPVVGTKPYAGGANYINKMSNYCAHCRYDHKSRRAETDLDRPPCPFNVFFWDFLIRHEDVFSKNHRMGMMMKNVAKMPSDERVAITVTAKSYREKFGVSNREDN
ncbi:MAG: cryptochrome/photolyase family protein [Planctomycetota bacterium]